ncbi:MAG TPA: RedB protein, partial [Myxococcaceae bacterium]|nr:RedB protein [Myxococcaceae bacterium]
KDDLHLDKLVRAAPKALEVEVIFIRPEGTPEGFARDSELWARAEAIPGVRVREDKDRVEARRFGATTSGQVLLYGVDGGLAFAGGITGARGHEGPNAGADRLLALLRGKGAPAQAPTFGCDLNDPQLPGAPL